MASSTRPCAAAAPALEIAIAEVKPTLVRVLARYRISGEDSKDLLHEVYVSFLQKYVTIEDPCGWLVGALRRQCLYFHRQQRHRLYDAVDSTLLEILAVSAPDSITQSALLSEIRTVIDTIHEPCRRLLYLRYHLGLERSEVASSLGYANAEVARGTEKRCIAQLTHKLEQSGRHLLNRSSTIASEVAHG